MPARASCVPQSVGMRGGPGCWNGRPAGPRMYPISIAVAGKINYRRRIIPSLGAGVSTPGRASPGMKVKMACGQRDDAPLRSCGVAPGTVNPGRWPGRRMAWKKNGLEEECERIVCRRPARPLKKGGAPRAASDWRVTSQSHIPDPGSQRLRSGRGRRPRLNVA